MSISPPFKPDSTYPRSYVLTQPFHLGKTFWNLPVPHYALDMAGYHGQPIYAASAGQVYQASWNGGGWAIGGGYTTIISHYGPGGRLARSVYAHMQRIVVWPGQWVLRGQLIGYADNTGNSNGSHCHFGFCEIYGSPGIYSNWIWIDPYRYMYAHSYQNGSRGNGDLTWSTHTRNQLIVGVAANGASRPTNVRTGPYLTSPVIEQVGWRKNYVFIGYVSGTSVNGSRTWNKMYDVARGRVAYVHSSLALWVT